jgi:hypothetical protein
VGEPESQGGILNDGIRGAVLGKAIDLASPVSIIDTLDGAGSARPFSVIDLAEVEKGLLHGALGRDPAILHCTPVLMRCSLPSSTRLWSSSLTNIAPGRALSKERGSATALFENETL